MLASGLAGVIIKKDVMLADSLGGVIIKKNVR